MEPPGLGSTHSQQLVAATQEEVRSRSPSPSKKPKRDASDAERLLDELLDEHQKKNSKELVPSWAVALQSSLDSKFAIVTEMMQGCHTRLAALESRSAQMVPDPRVDELAVKVEELTRLVASRQQPNTGSKPADHNTMGSSGTKSLDAWANYTARTDMPAGSRSSIPPPQQGYLPRITAEGDTDFNHVVAGGWDFDTPRRFIMADLENMQRKFTTPFDGYIERTVVYGQRAKVGHFYLTPVPQDVAADRFYRMQELFSNKFQTGSGSFIWLSPSRTPARRSMNRATRRASDFILSLWPGEPPQQQEIGWSKQVIWQGPRRVAACSSSALYPGGSDKVATRTFQDGDQATRFLFNLSALAALSGLSEADIEVQLQSFDR